MGNRFQSVRSPFRLDFSPYRVPGSAVGAGDAVVPKKQALAPRSWLGLVAELGSRQGM